MIFLTSLKRFSTPTFSLLLISLLSACGGGSDDTINPPQITTNEALISVNNGGDFGALNSPFITLTLCSPANASSCATIDRILVDTGSVGLRVFAQPRGASTSLASLNLPQQMSGANPVVECLPFVQGNVWGPIKYGTVHIGEKTADNIPIQVIADPQFSSIPNTCSSQGLMLHTPADLRANGILGIGIYPEDCGTSCAASNSTMQVYFACSSNGNNCISIPQAIANQVQHPVTRFGSDNNGVIVTLRPITSNDGTSAIEGSLIFGIDTQNNNASNHVNTILINNTPGNSTAGYFTTSLNGINYPYSFFDTGSNGYFFNLPGLNQCATYPGFYCPATTQFLNATILGDQGSAANVSFNIANSDALFSNWSYYAFDNIGGTAGSNLIFDWGLPFFYGKRVYVVPAGSASNQASGPYVGW